MSNRNIDPVFKTMFDQMISELAEVIQVELANMDFLHASKGRLKAIADDVSEPLIAQWCEQKKRWELRKFVADPIWLYRYTNDEKSTVIGWCIVRDVRDYIVAGYPQDLFAFEWLSANVIAVRLGYESFLAYVRVHRNAKIPQAEVA